MWLFEGKMISALQHDLKALGFVMCLTTRELRDDGLESNVGIGRPKRWAVENGIYTVNDDNGHPWIAPDPSNGGLFSKKVFLLVQIHQLQPGCHVCHAHDDGDFIRRQYPVLRQRQHQSVGI